MSAFELLADELRSFAEEAGPELVPRRALQSCDAGLRMFADAGPELALEVHVADPDPEPTIDLTLRVHRAHLHRLEESTYRPPHVQRILQRWKESRLLARVPFIEFELDLEHEPEMPWVGPAVEPELRRGPVWIQRARDQGDAYDGPRPADAELVRAIMQELGGADTATEAKVLALVSGMPRLGLVSQLALLDGRASSPQTGVRVFVSLPRSALASTLASVGWPGDLRRVLEMYERFSPETTWVDVDFNLSAAPTAPTLSFYREFLAPRMANSSLRSVLATIGELSLTTRERLDAIARFVAANDSRVDRLVTFKVTVLPERVRLKLYLSALNRSPDPDGNAPR